VDRITRKELKSDKFALEVEHTVEYVSEHRRQVIRYAAVAAVVVVLVLAFMAYRNRQQAVRQTALNAALEIQNAAIGAAPNPESLAFPTGEARNKAALKAFGDIAAKYQGSDEGWIAEYYQGVIASDEGRLSDAQRFFKDVADSGPRTYGSLAKLSLAELYGQAGRIADAEPLLRSLMDKPTEFVSKAQATIELGRLLGPSRPAEARKLLEPLRTEGSTVSRMAIAALGDIPQR
jgi:tetratricopeptide (TPR) repeat protein